MTDQLKAQIDQLPAEERAELAHYLIQSLDQEADPGAEAAWDAELSRRVEEIRCGNAPGEAAETVFARLLKRTQ